MKTKRGHVLLMLLSLILFFFTLSCSSLPSLPSLPDTEIPAEAEIVSLPDEPAESVDTEDLPVPETAFDKEPESAEKEEDTPEIWRRVEETLAYLDTPVNPDLPEPEYAIPEPGPPVADVEPSLASDEPIEPNEPAAEIANESEDNAEPEEELPPDPPLPPIILRPVEEIAAVQPPRKPLPIPPSPLPMQPARIPASETKLQDSAPPPHRTIQATVGENAEIPLPGSGWVYLGETDNQSGLAYRQRRTSADGQVFVFRPENTGSYRLKFTKQDLLRGTETSEIVEVTVIEKQTPDDMPPSPVIAAADTEAAPISVETPPPSADIDTVPPAVPATAEPDDAALWNRGQKLEAAGPDRDMKGALAAYKTLVHDYPQSGYYTDSQKRIAYIERFFVNIR
jgi:hypothetical protein